MNNIEQNMVKSFKRVKSDIVALQEQLLDISRKQTEIIEMVGENKETLAKKPTTTPHHKKTFVASKTGKSFHLTNCPFAKNIKPKSKITFKSKEVALNKGFKPCECVKKI